MIPAQKLTLRTSKFIFRKLDLITRQQWLAVSRPEDRDLFATEENLSEAVEILEMAWSVYEDELFAPFAWSMRAFPQYHMMLYILWHLCVHPQATGAERAWRAIELFCTKTTLSRLGLELGTKWPVIVAMKKKAMAIRRQHLRLDDAAHEGTCPTPTDTEMRSEDGAGESLPQGPRGEMLDWASALQAMPDWSTFMQEFSLTENDFTLF